MVEGNCCLPKNFAVCRALCADTWADIEPSMHMSPSVLVAKTPHQPLDAVALSWRRWYQNEG